MRVLHAQNYLTWLCLNSERDCSLCMMFPSTLIHFLSGSRFLNVMTLFGPSVLFSLCFFLPTFVCVLVTGNIKASRRSSYLLAITTERSKSCDDGLNTFRDEGKLLRWV